MQIYLPHFFPPSLFFPPLLSLSNAQKEAEDSLFPFIFDLFFFSRGGQKCCEFLIIICNLSR